MKGSEEKGFSVVDRRINFDEPLDDEDIEIVEDSRPTYVEDLERQVEESKRQVSEIKTQYKAALDEFENARARQGRDAAIEIRKGRRMVVAEMLEVLDNLERAIEAGHEGTDAESLLQGVELVRNLFVSKLEGLGVERYESLGHPFDPERHQAISTVPVDDPEEDGQVVGVIADGYTFGDDLLRHALVAVGKAKDPGVPPEE